MIIVKIGGGAGINLQGIADDLADFAGRDEPVIVVHGANALRNQLADRLGITIETVTSLSGVSSVLSDDGVIDLMMMAYAGMTNKKMVEMLQQRGVNAIGLSGLDGRVLTAKRNQGIRVQQNGKKVLLRDRSGRAFSVNDKLLHLLLDGGYTPVLTMPLIDETGTAVNSENDDVVAALHQKLNAGKIVFLIEASGLLSDPADEGSLIKNVDISSLKDYESRAKTRMRRKLRAIRKIVEFAPAKVMIADGRSAHPLVDAINGQGTVVQC